MVRGFCFSALLLIVLALCACEGESKPAVAPRGKPTYGTSTIKGVVKFIGTPPPRATIENSICGEGAPELKDETVVVNSDGTLANTFVYLTGVAASDGADREAALLDQKFCRYTPHVVGVQVGQTLRIKSSDATLHNVHYSANANTPGNFGLTVAGSEKPVTFQQPEMIRVKCDVHPWMTAYVGVFETPFFANTTEKNGSWTIEKVPAGTYTLIAWHEQFGELKQQVSVKDNESVEVNFEFKQQ